MPGIDQSTAGRRAESLPNSPAQQARLRAVTQIGAVGSLAHCVAAGLDIRGWIEPSVLSAALTEVVRSRPALRSVFGHDRDSHQVTGAGAVPVRRVRVPGDTDQERWQAARACARAEAHRPFPLGEVPLLEAVLFDTQDRGLLLLKVDQLVGDAWSVNLIVDQLVAAADRLVRGLPPAPAECDAYPQVWRSRDAWLTGPPGRAAVARRQAALTGHAVRWPMAGRRPLDDVEMVEQELVMSAPDTGRLRERTRRSGGSVLAAAALALASAQLGPQERMALASTFACRQSLAEEAVVGSFANEVAVPLPPRTGTVLEAVRGMRASLVGAVNDQAAPYDLVLDREHAGDPRAGLTVALLYLPLQLSGTEQLAMRIGETVVERCGVAICPTAADVDLYVVENLAVGEHHGEVEFSVGAMSGRGGLDREAVRALLERWWQALVGLGRLDWRADDIRALSALTDRMPTGAHRSAG